jgi:hypothetical protein
MGAVVLIILLMCAQNVSASDIKVNPSTVKIIFDQPKQPYETVPKSTEIIITNQGDETEVTIQCDIPGTITPPPFNLSTGEPKTITITALSTAEEGSHDLFINAHGTLTTVPVIIVYKAKIKVSLDTIHFGTKDSPLHRTDSPPPQKIKLSEVYGYKNVTVKISRPRNAWVTSNPPDSIFIPARSSGEIEFTLTPRTPDRNEYSWAFSLSPTGNAEISSNTITIEAYILMPATLDVDKLTDKKLEIKFNKQKGTVSAYEGLIDIEVGNIGDEPMNYMWHLDIELPAGSYLRADRSSGSGSVSGKDSDNIEVIEVHIIAPYDAPEGTYPGKLHIDATDEYGKYAGEGDVTITIKIKWLVDFTISSTSPYFTPFPPSIGFGSLELKEQGYEKKSVDLTLTEFYHYKSVRNLRFSKSGEYGEWLHDDKDFSKIPPGESRSFTLKIEPGLEAVPKSYSWKYDISASEISRKRMEIKAKIVPINIPEMMEYLKSFRESILYKSYPLSEVIISNGVEMLEVVERSEIGAEDWKKIPVLMKGTLSLLSSLNDGITFSEEENYGKAVENLVSASVSTSTIGSNSELNNWDISGYAKDISTGADKTTEEVLRDEAKKLELRGWNIKKAVEHAMAMDDISGLKKEENVLESALSYQYAATIYGLLNDKEKKLECVYEESLLMDKHEELVSDATHFRIEADKNIMNSRENDLIRIWNTHLLLNPYKYELFLRAMDWRRNTWKMH